MMIKPILYERIEQKNEIERKMFSNLTKKEKSAIRKSWRKLFKVMKAKKKKKLSETEYLLSSPLNAKRLLEGVRQHKAASGTRKKKIVKKK
jgi:DNA/RNA-binding domain of Phe-tRNA-synthetase-like protein